MWATLVEAYVVGNETVPWELGGLGSSARGTVQGGRGRAERLMRAACLDQSVESRRITVRASAPQQAMRPRAERGMRTKITCERRTQDQTHAGSTYEEIARELGIARVRPTAREPRGMASARGQGRTGPDRCSED